MQIIRLLPIVLLLCALCVTEPVVAEDKPEETTKPREFSEEEIKAADDLRLTLSTEQQTLFNGLRYLMRPQFEAELLKGRQYRPCTLPPFEEKADGALTLLETLRFWAVLQSGMPTTGSCDRQLQRLLDVPLPPEKTRKSILNLAPLAVQIMTLRAVLARPELGRADEIKQRATTLIRMTDEAALGTWDRSSLIKGDVIDSQWFANHMWRSLIMRAAPDFGIEPDEKQWEKDLRALAAAYVKDRGWTASKRGTMTAPTDLHTNYLAMVALGLAVTAPEGFVSNTVLRTIEKKLKYVPEVLARLDTDYSAQVFAGSRLNLLTTLPTDYAPERITPATWREDHIRQGVAMLEPAGWIYARHDLAGEIGLSESSWSRSDTTVCETSLGCIALSGGLLAPLPGPLAKRELASVGRILYAFAVLHANHARVGGSDFISRVNYAIQDGAELLRSIQTDNGSFPGTYAGYPGNTGYSLLAMMHGGISRDDECIKRGLDWMTSEGVKGYFTSYDVSAMLMCLQKYYEPEQREAGILYVNDAQEFEEARRKVWASLEKDHAKFIERMVKFLDDSANPGAKGGWGYMSAAANMGRGEYGDNSCSQYAVLGYKAASLLGATLDTKLFEKEAERLIKQYWANPNLDEIEYEHDSDDREGDDAERKDRKTRDVFRDKIGPGGWAYMCGASTSANMQMTAAGISSLTICMDELKVRGKLKEKLAQKIGLTIHGAQHYLAGVYYKPEVFAGPASPLGIGSSDGWGAFYNLYSVERGCVLAGIRQLRGEVDWYEIGAEALLDGQNMDGSWGREANMQRGGAHQVINTCLAILFLKRAAMPVVTEHKKREKEAEEERKRREAAKNPITGEPKKREPEPEK